MSFVQNFPFFSIIIAMFSGIISSVLPAKAAEAKVKIFEAEVSFSLFEERRITPHTIGKIIGTSNIIFVIMTVLSSRRQQRHIYFQPNIESPDFIRFTIGSDIIPKNRFNAISATQTAANTGGFFAFVKTPLPESGHESCGIYIVITVLKK